MASKVLGKIRACVRSGSYELTTHANDEMADDELSILEVESSMLSGRIVRIQKGDFLGDKYTIHGPGKHSETRICTIGRFLASGRYRIVTIYEIQCED